MTIRRVVWLAPAIAALCGCDGKSTSEASGGTAGTVTGGAADSGGATAGGKGGASGSDGGTGTSGGGTSGSNGGTGAAGASGGQGPDACTACAEEIFRSGACACQNVFCETNPRAGCGEAPAVFDCIRAGAPPRSCYCRYAPESARPGCVEDTRYPDCVLQECSGSCPSNPLDYPAEPSGGSCGSCLWCAPAYCPCGERGQEQACTAAQTELVECMGQSEDVSACYAELSAEQQDLLREFYDCAARDVCGWTCLPGASGE